ncbi:MAG: TonB-dependent receptor [Gammaproteobacteria bacterium]
MSPVVVTATRTPVEERDVPAATTVITQEDIKQTPAQDLAEIIRESTGISLFGNGVGNRRAINMRGMEARHTLILINGRRISTSEPYFGHSDFENSWIPAEAIERIEIVRGPLSSLYGSEGMGGVINIITRKSLDEWGGTISATAGQRDDNRGGSERGIGFFAGGPLGDKTSLTVNGELSDQDKTEDKDDPDISEIEGKEITALGFTLGYEPAEGHVIELSHNRVDEERPRDTRSRPPGSILHESTYDLERRTTSVEHRGTFGEANTTLRFYESSIQQKNRTDNVAVAPTNPQKLTDRVLEGFTSIPLGEMHLLTAGVEQREETLDHPDMAGGGDSVDNSAIYVQDEMEITKDLLFTAGVRIDDHQLFGSETSPRAYVVYHLSDTLTLKGGYGEAFRAPTLKQISPSYMFVGFHTFLGNANVKPETSKTTEIALEFRGNGTRAGITIFKNEIDDLIEAICILNCVGPPPRTYEYQNVDKARIEGVEAEFSTDLSSGFNFAVNLTTLDAVDRTTGLPLANRPELTVNTTLGWHSSDNDWAVALRGQYVGEQVNYDGTTRIDLPNYKLWHLNVRKRLNKAFTLRAGVENIGDVRLADKNDGFSFEERGRFYYLGVDASF